MELSRKDYILILKQRRMGYGTAMVLGSAAYREFHKILKKEYNRHCAEGEASYQLQKLVSSLNSKNKSNIKILKRNESKTRIRKCRRV